MSSVWDIFPPLPRGTLIRTQPTWGNNIPWNIKDDFFIVLEWRTTTAKRQILILHPPTGGRYSVYPDEIVLEGYRAWEVESEDR